MTEYRLSELGVERIEAGQSTFIHKDPSRPAWREFETWCALGNRPLAISPRCLTPKKLRIIGAGGYGRTVHCLAVTARGNGLEWNIDSFLNDGADALDGFPGFPPILGDTGFQPGPDDLFICAIGDVGGRKLVAEKFKARGACFVNLIQKTAPNWTTVVFGEGIIVEGFVGMGANVRIGDFTSILSHTVIGHDVNLGRYVQVSPGASVLGWAEIGDEVFIGSNATILPHVKVGARAVIGAGSVVIKNVPEGATMFGVPASRIQ